jgi:hypothetical protein
MKEEHMKGKWNLESAMARMKEKRCEVNQDKKQVFVRPEQGVIGNDTLGALDYLKKQHKYSVVFMEVS